MSLPSRFLRTSSSRVLLRTFKSHLSQRAFSVTSCARIMETSGFTESQMDVREAIFKICAKYPDVSSSVSFLLYPISSILHISIRVKSDIDFNAPSAQVSI